MRDLTDRRYADSLHREAGWALKRCATQQNQLALALDLNPSSVSRMCAGASWGWVQRAVEGLVKLARARKTSPAPILSHLRQAVVEEYEGMDAPEVAERLERSLDTETPAQADEDLAEYNLIRALREDDPAALIRALDIYIEASQIEVDWQENAIVMAQALRRMLSR